MGNSAGNALSALTRKAWLIAPVLLVVIILLGLSSPTAVWNPPNLIPALNVIFLSSISFFVSILAAISFLKDRSVVALLLGGGTLALGLGASMASLPSVNATANSMIVMYNTAALLAGLLNLAAAAILSSAKPKRLESKWAPLIIAYLMITALAGLLLLLEMNGSWPVYFIAGSGQTMIGRLVLLASVLLFFISASILAVQRRNAGNDFSYWYAVGLALIAIGLMGVSLQANIGDALNWIGRISQYLGMLFMVVAVYTSVKASGTWLLPLEKALRESEDRYQALVRTSPDAIMVISNGKVAFANQAAVRLLHIPPGTNAVGMRSGDLAEGAHSLDLAQHMARLLRGDAVPAWETNVRTMDGASVEVEICGSTIEFDSQHSVLLILRDISQRKKAEEDLRKQERVLRTVLDNSRDGINMLDLRTGKYVFLSPSQAELTGFTIEEILGIAAKEAYERVHPEDRHKSVDQQAAVAAGIDMPDPIEYRWMVKSGEYRWFSDRRKLVRDEQGRPVALVGISRDITEEKNAQRVMRDYSIRLEQSNAELQQFAYISSHDLQEPLRMVIANLSQLERKHGDSLDEEARAYIDRAIDGGARMRELIDDLLTYSRVESQAKEVGPVDMEEVTRSVLGLMEATVRESGAELDIGTLPVVRANESQMRQVMQNLLSNALKFRGARAPRIEVWAEPGWQEWTFAVKDNGIGFDMAYADKIFDMFQRLHTRDRYPGNGVGLAIVKKIVERHGGRVWVQSSVDSGSTFYFTLPKEV
jgi:PAS domain S-box-containing protein